MINVLKFCCCTLLLLCSQSAFSQNECRLQLVKIECITSEGDIFADAIYFKLDGNEWPSKRLRMSTNDTYDLEGYVDIRFNSYISIELWDDDTLDPDDFLGRHLIDCAFNPMGTLRFTQDGANYKLSFRVF